MDTRTINILITSFPGLSLPPTLSLPTPATTPISTFISTLTDRLPSLRSRLVVTTSSNKELSPSSTAPISTLLPPNNDASPLLPLRLTTPLCGGKGGFGSQLRAAGGRMSSRKKKNLGPQTSSSRNLDGRRLRTVAEAKALAEYLALKPEMEKAEKEKRRKRWELVVEAAERREEEIRGGKGRVDGRLGEEREEVGERARMAVRGAMGGGVWVDGLGLGDVEEDEDEGLDEQAGQDGSGGTKAAGQGKSGDAAAVKGKGTPSRVFFGFEEEDEWMSEDIQNEEGGAELDTSAGSVSRSVAKGKGKAKL